MNLIQTHVDSLPHGWEHQCCVTCADTLQQRYLQRSSAKTLQNVMSKIHLLFSAGYSVVGYWRDTRWEQTGSWGVLQALLLAFNKGFQAFCLL